MDEALRKYLDGDRLTADAYLYRLEEVMGFDDPVCKVIEELRPMIKYFAEKGIPMPQQLPRPDLTGTGRRSVRVCLGKIKLGVSAAWEREQFTEDDRAKAKRLHRLANDVRAMCGQDDRPEGFLTGGFRD